MNESSLRLIIRQMIYEACCDDDSDRIQLPKDDKVLGEPDLSSEDERDNPAYKPPEEEPSRNEVSAVGAGGAPAGNIRGVTGPLGLATTAHHLEDRPVTNGGPSDYLRGKKSKKKKK